MSADRRLGLPLLVAIVGLIAAFLVASRGSALKSPQDTQKILNELGITWRGAGPPVVVFSAPG